VTTLEQLEKNRFETAAIYGKKLLLITDSDKYGGEVSTLKAITGGDPIRFEKKKVSSVKLSRPLAWSSSPLMSHHNPLTIPAV
jgi:phage/plasmid-associated DNA primase